VSGVGDRSRQTPVVPRGRRLRNGDRYRRGRTRPRALAVVGRVLDGGLVADEGTFLWVVRTIGTTPVRLGVTCAAEGGVFRADRGTCCIPTEFFDDPTALVTEAPIETLVAPFVEASRRCAPVDRLRTPS
jgi:hypothetical protein